MITPELSLALSMQSNKGVYTLFLGSGVSRSTGMPTGWEVVLDLIRKLARLKGEDCEPSPEAWFRATFKQNPDYSSILDQVTHSPTERSQLLREYFEPTEEERQEGRKTPTPAHRAIAELISRGYIRVIVTTNFDRLLEQALVDVGIQPSVISSADTAAGALPLAHSRCTIIKINGDYLDTRLRNTREELAEYEAPLVNLLNQIFDEYGLIICGWSGDSDIALRDIMERCPTRRFPMYWALHGRLSERARDLVHLRGAKELPISGADAFFRDLLDKLESLETFAISDPLSVKVAVARMKRYLTSDTYRISLHDMLNTEVDRTQAALQLPRQATGPISPEVIAQQVGQYEAAVEVLLSVLVTAAYWAEAQHDNLLLQAFSRIANESVSGAGGWLDEFRRYPAFLIFYALGLSTVASRNVRLLRKLLVTPIRLDPQQAPQAAVAELFNRKVMRLDLAQEFFPGQQRMHTPLNNHVYEKLRKPLRDQFPEDTNYAFGFDTWEYLMGLQFIDGKYSKQELSRALAEKQSWQSNVWAPVGRFTWRRDNEDTVQRLVTIPEDGQVPDFLGSLFDAGFFGGRADLERYQLVKSALDSYIQVVRNHQHFS